MNQKNESTLSCENSPQLVEVKYLFLLDHFSEATAEISDFFEKSSEVQTFFCSLLPCKTRIVF